MNEPATPGIEPDRTLSGRIRERLKYSPRMLPDAFWTLTGQVMTVLSGILIFKIVSRWVPAHQYGQASLVLGIVGLLSNLILGPVVLAHMRLYHEHALEGRGQAYIRAVFRLLLRTAAVQSAIYLSAALVYYSLHDATYLALAAPAILLLFAQTQLTGLVGFLEMEKRYRTLTIAQSLSKVLQVPFLGLLLFLAMSGRVAVVSSQMLAAAAVTLMWGAVSWRRNVAGVAEVEFSTREVAAAAARVFGWSIYLFNLFGWVLATSDRYIIEHFWSAKEVGIYALNYGLWSVPYLSLNSWLEAMVRARIFERAEAKDWLGVRRLLRHRTMLAMLLGAVLTVVIYFAGRRIAREIIGEKYWYGEELMMLICTGHFFYIVAASFHPIFQALKRTQALMLIALVTSVLNVAANLVVVPRMSILGAGWSTFAAYACMCVITLIAAPLVISSASRERGLDEKS